MRCPVCGRDTPEERKTLLGVTTCISCTPQQEIYGIMNYDSKAGGVLNVLHSREEFERLRRPANTWR